LITNIKYSLFNWLLFLLLDLVRTNKQKRFVG
jgi:hypothetical protein